MDAALAADRADVGKRLLALAEDQWFERKSIRVRAQDLDKPLTAFANAEGGVIVVGLSNGGVEGIRAHASKENAIRQAALDFTVPAVRAHVEQVSCINDAGENDSLLVIRVDPGELVHETRAGEVYLRVGDESRKLGFAARQELEFDKGQGQYDGRPVPGVSIADLASGFHGGVAAVGVLSR